MAIFEDLENKIESLETPWNEKTGQQVEDLISRHLVNSMDFADSTLTLRDYNGDAITSTRVTVETPSYDQDVLVVAVRINGTIYKTGEVIMQCNSKSKVELAVATSHTSTTQSFGVQDAAGVVKVKIQYGVNSMETAVAPYALKDFTLDSSGTRIEHLNKADSELKWINITELFTDSQESTITATLVDYPQKSSVLNVSIKSQKISLSYTGNVVSNNAEFTLKGGSPADYHLEGYLNANRIYTTDGNLSYNELQSGLNILTVKAVHKSQNIATDYVNACIIKSEGFTGVAVAVNGITGSINNHDTVKLYTITVYSPTKDSVTINTYLNSDSSQDRQNLLDTIIVNAQNYDSDNKYETTYKKYIEVNSDNAKQYLQVEVNGQLYQFQSAGSDKAFMSNNQTLSISKANINYLYTSSPRPTINFDQISGRTTTLFNDSLDYWKATDGKIIYRVEANTNKVFETPVNLQLSNNFTLEFGFKSYNVSNEESPVITFGQMLIKPTVVCWNTSAEQLYNARFAQFKEDVDTHITITVQKGFTLNQNDPYYPNYFLAQDSYDTLKANMESAKFNLVRIYVNGVINREISIDDATLLALQREAQLQINPKGSDLDLYLLRVYNSTALTFDQIQHNYISFLATREQKDKFYDRNNILGTNGAISFAKSFGKYNTLVYVFPKGGKLPNRTWQGENNKPGDQDKAAKNIKCTLFINYTDQEKNKIYGGRINNGLVKGQGSSAMRYLIWNTTFQLNKFKDGETKVKSVFTPYEDLDTATNKFIAKPTHQKEGYYNMPPYDGQTDSTEKDLKVTKLVGKVNFASSMQSHKEGSCKLYNDAYKSDSDQNGLLNGGRKAVHEEAFLYFYLITDLESVANYELADLLRNPNVQFMGFQTFGSAKGDKATFGYDDDKTPEYILIEGGENSDPHVNFRRPWAALQRVGLNAAGSKTLTNFPTVTVEEQQSLNRDYTKNLWISDESIVYQNRGSWDVNFGLNDDATDFTEPARKSLNKFGEFVDFVYKYNFNLVKTGETDTTKWNTLNRYIATKAIPAFTGSREGDIYRYDEFAGSTSATGEAVGGWVRGGTIYDPSTGWSRLNIYEDFEIDSSINQLDIAIDELKSLFKRGITKYIDVNDVAMHQAVIRFLSGTDNRAKNTYFQIFGKIYENIAQADEADNWQPSDKGDYLIRLYGDDLDTVIATDNNGLQSKPYNLLEPSYVPETASQWGDSGLNAFFYMFDLQFEDIIKNKLYKVINQAFGTASGENTNFYKYFYSIQADKYPAIAYNHTSQIYYENAQIIKNAGAIEYYDNNQIEPIEQSHGSCLEGEQQFMEKRRNFLASYTKQSTTPDYPTGSSAGGNERPLQLRLEFTPFQDFYPTYYYDGTKYLMPNSGTDYRPDIIKYLAKADQDYVVNLKETGTAINEGLISTVLFKKLNITGLVNYSIAPEKEYTRLTNFTIDNNNLKTYKDFFGTDYPEYRLDVFSMKGPVLESLILNNMTTLETLNLTDFNKLKEINLSGTTFKRVILPSKAETVILPETIETLELYNPVKELRLEGISNLKTVDLSNVGQFDVDSFLEQLVDCNSLESVSLRNLTINVTEQTLSKLLSVKNNITGTINIVDSTGDLVEISYDTKKSLVEQFGDIDNVTNNPKVNYKASSSAFSATCDSEITIFGLGDKGTGKFNLQINSNQVEIVNDPTPRLHIDYQLASSSYDQYLKVDSKTGNITLIRESTTVQPVINILVYRIGNSTPTRLTCKVKIQWVAPQIGDFVYYDGSYSNNYNANKTCVGMVYAVENTNSENTSGTAYVIGKENMTEEASFYLGFSPEGVNGGDDLTLKELYYIGDWLKNQRLITSANSSDSNDYIAMSGVSTDKPVDQITYNSYTDFTTNGFTGKEDTAIYVNTVNTSVLSKLYSSFQNQVKSYITYDSTTQTYSIKSMDKLVALCKGLKITNVTSDELSSCVIYPYYYASTLYQPTLKPTESTIYNQFAQGNWYVPSAKQLARIMYYRGYSAKGTNFIDSTSVAETISKISSGTEAKNKAIFSNAKSVMGTNFPSVWANIANNQNTTTTINTSSNYNSYSYQNMCTDYSCAAHRYEWIPGKKFTVGSYDYNQYQYEAAWRVTKHQGVPFTQFTYNKDTQND